MSISSFIVTSLQLGLDTLAAKADVPGIGINKDAIPVLEGFIAATEVLIESAEEVGAACGDPIMRGGIFDYGKKLRQQSNVLQVGSDVPFRLLGTPSCPLPSRELTALLNLPYTITTTSSGDPRGFGERNGRGRDHAREDDEGPPTHRRAHFPAGGDRRRSGPEDPQRNGQGVCPGASFAPSGNVRLELT